ncbi:hypothetical protein Y1Q_0023154 [Alligator mississippiensis]|uniref:Uncharacterized protein n=1 Tax=Alligator mississippiensis TaxID=8496 RepID=A0A151MZ51_ALLMI|nr:hypothetical protein Y1Q_0023154 [Alligator mississippiensis]
MAFTWRQVLRRCYPLLKPVAFKGIQLALFAFFSGKIHNLDLSSTALNSISASSSACSLNCWERLVCNTSKFLYSRCR